MTTDLEAPLREIADFICDMIGNDYRYDRHMAHHLGGAVQTVFAREQYYQSQSSACPRSLPISTTNLASTELPAGFKSKEWNSRRATAKGELELDVKETDGLNHF